MSLTGTTSFVQGPDGSRLFRKALTGAPKDFFVFEATGLAMLDSLGARVPKVVEVTQDHLLLQVVQAQPGAPQVADPETAFGHELAQLHLAGRQAAGAQQDFGSLAGVSAWFLGAQPINLEGAPTLFESLVVNRVQPLTLQAVEAGLLDPLAQDLVMRLRPEHLGPVEEPPTVVHGDLWAGNRMVDASGTSWLIDPSCHWGHREQDIAMMHLFGGFPPTVFQAYDSVFPLVPLLVHVVLFGSGYASATMRALQTVLGP